MVDIQLPGPKDVVDFVDKQFDKADDVIEDNLPGWAADIYKDMKDLPKQIGPLRDIWPAFDSIDDLLDGAREKICQSLPLAGEFFPGICPPEKHHENDDADGYEEGDQGGGAGNTTHYEKEDFDKLHPDVAAFLKSANAQSIDIDGENVHVKLAEGYEQEVDGAKLKFAEDITFKLRKEENGEIHMWDIEGIKAEVGGPLGTSFDVSIKEMTMREQDGKTVATIKADTPIGDKTETHEVPREIFAFAENLTEGEPTATA